MIELFNDSATAKEGNMRYSSKSLSNKRLGVIITEICDLPENGRDQRNLE